MPGIDEVYERLITDPSFRQQVEADPAAALGPFDLSEDELTQLAQKFTRTSGDPGKMEERTSKSALISLIGSLIGDPGGTTAFPKVEDTEPVQYSEFADSNQSAAPVPSWTFQNALPSKVDMDPQAWPSKIESGQGAPSPTADAEAVGFNPQPEPPAQEGFTSDLETKGFNPQPEPPASEADAVGQKVRMDDGLSIPEDSLLSDQDSGPATRVTGADAVTIKQGISEEDVAVESDFEIEG